MKIVGRPVVGWTTFRANIMLKDPMHVLNLREDDRSVTDWWYSLNHPWANQESTFKTARYSTFDVINIPLIMSNTSLLYWSIPTNITFLTTCHALINNNNKQLKHCNLFSSFFRVINRVWMTILIKRRNSF